jgi:hypothetical protein
MKPMTGLFAAVAALSVISTAVEAADGCGRGSVDETSRATHRPIRPLRPGTTAPRITPFRMVCVSRTEVAETSFLMAQTAVRR